VLGHLPAMCCFFALYVGLAVKLGYVCVETLLLSIGHGVLNLSLELY
jgi:uncharacterized membrane protein